MSRLIDGQDRYKLLRRLCGFLWKWKVASTSMLAVRYFMHAKDPGLRAYQFLLNLERHRFVSRHCNSLGSIAVWTLDKRGFEVASEVYGNQIAENGWRSENLDHDILVLKAHLGDYIHGALPETVDLLSEQELRRLPDFAIVSRLGWLPDHRSDGYFIFRMGDRNRIISLEVERSGKAPALLDNVYRYYDNTRWLTGCVWIARDKLVFNALKRSQLKVNPQVDVHHYVYESDFDKLGGDAEIFGSPLAGQKVGDYLFRNKEEFQPKSRIQVDNMFRFEALRDISRSAQNFRKFCEIKKAENECLYSHPQENLNKKEHSLTTRDLL